MYPNLYYVLRDFFGVNWPFFKIIGTFGFFMAVAFFAAALLLDKELKRKQAEGIFTYTERVITVGKPAGIAELLLTFILTFIVGYKVLGLLFIDHAMDDPIGFVFSAKGSFVFGLLLSIFLTGWLWWEKNREKLPTPEQRKIHIWPGDRVGEITVIAVIAGLIGAKIFDNLENWSRFVADPVGNLFSRSGLTFYGGLIIATLALWYYFYKSKIRFIDVCDAAAPSLMLAYGIGRIGCHISGDGDWGIINSAYLAEPNGGLGDCNPNKLNTALNMYSYIYQYPGANAQPVQHKTVDAFGGLPDWLFAYSYPHNTLKAGVPTTNCNFDEYCNHLPLPVFPTPLYEVIMALLIFALLWSLRKKIKIAGRLFAVYLILNGVERFLIEQIRVNTKYSFLGLHPTQAELISLGLVVGGIFLYWYAPKIKNPFPAKPVSEEAEPT